MTEESHTIGSQAPPKRKRVATALALLAALAIGAAGGLWLGGRGAKPGPHADNAAAAHVEGEQYTCGMHPFIISDKPGNCPICGMALTKIEKSPPPGGAASTAAKASGGPRKIVFYRNPMNPDVTSHTPAKDEMGMDYVPVYEDEIRGGGGPMPEGYAAVNLGAERVALAGIQSAPAVREAISRPVRAVGLVVPDETRVRRVQSKVDGYVEKLYTNFTGQVVTKGQPLMAIYSPELLATQQEYLKARETAAKFAASSSDDVRKLGEELLQASRRRLELFDVPPAFIAELERTGTARRTVTINAPVGGYVTGKEVFEGTRVGPGMELLTVTDLSRVWIEADLYEYEAQSVRVGQPASLETAADPAAKLKGRVAFIYPVLSPETRTLKVRFEFPNPGLRLKPQMYANVALDLHGVTGVVVPDSALIDTGVRTIAFVDVGDGRFEPRELKIGVRGNGRAQVLLGVSEGEKVATRANFLLDSESKLRAALTKMAAPAPAGAPAQPPAKGQPAPPAQGGHAGHGG
jgi:RND family efflux transporter MFP subunit